MDIDCENPLHAGNIPVAKLVVIEVEGEPIQEPKVRPAYDICIKILEYIQLCGAVLLLIGMFGGIILFMIWGFNPYVFGVAHDD
jgi:hypothetical protein